MVIVRGPGTTNRPRCTGEIRAHAVDGQSELRAADACPDEFHVLDFLDGLVDRQLIELRQFFLRQRKRGSEIEKTGAE